MADTTQTRTEVHDDFVHVGDEPLRVAVVGLGYWGPNLVRNLADLPQTDVAAVCDSSEQALAKITSRYPTIRTAETFDSVIDDDSIEAVAIATPISTHFGMAEAALRAGKHVFVEKPLAGSSEDAARLVALAAELRLVLMPGHTFLYSPPVNKIRDLIVSGSLGDIYFISTSRVNLGLYQHDAASVTWDLAPHDFSILRYWLGEMPTHVAAFSRCCVIPSVPDVAFIHLSFPSDAIAHVELSWLAPSKLRRTAVVGSEKMVVYDDTSNEPVRVFDSGVVPRDPQSFGEFQLSYRAGDIISPRIEGIEPLELEMVDFFRAVREGSPPRSSPEIGLGVVRMLEAVDSSLEAGGAPVAVPSG